jgi:CheY-like chemotaxis protein
MHGSSSHTLPPPPSPTPRALIADDQPDLLTALRLLLRNAGYQTKAVTSPAEVLDAIKESDFDLVLMDLNYARDTTSGQEGLDLITNIQNQLLNGGHKLRAAELRDRIMEAVKEFSDGEVYDDATLMIVRVD